MDRLFGIFANPNVIVQCNGPNTYHNPFLSPNNQSYSIYIVWD